MPSPTPITSTDGNNVLTPTSFKRQKLERFRTCNQDDVNNLALATKSQATLKQTRWGVTVLTGNVFLSLFEYLPGKIVDLFLL